MICPVNLQNVLEWNVDMWSKRDSLNSPETYNMASSCLNFRPLLKLDTEQLGCL